MTNLKLITTETFGDLPCNFYHNMNKERLNELSTTLKVRTTDGKEYNTSRNQETEDIEDIYNIEINDYIEAYKSEFNL